jgi:hypothetical protein
VASTLLRLADVMLEQRKFSMAKPLHEQALVIRRRAFGENHAEVALSLTKLGGMLLLATYDIDTHRDKHTHRYMHTHLTHMA